MAEVGSVATRGWAHPPRHGRGEQVGPVGRELICMHSMAAMHSMGTRGHAHRAWLAGGCTWCWSPSASAESPGTVYKQAHCLPNQSAPWGRTQGWWPAHSLPTASIPDSGAILGEPRTEKKKEVFHCFQSRTTSTCRVVTEPETKLMVVQQRVAGQHLDHLTGKLQVSQSRRGRSPWEECPCALSSLT